MKCCSYVLAGLSSVHIEHGESKLLRAQPQASEPLYEASISTTLKTVPLAESKPNHIARTCSVTPTLWSLTRPSW